MRPRPAIQHARKRGKKYNGNTNERPRSRCVNTCSLTGPRRSERDRLVENSTYKPRFDTDRRDRAVAMLRGATDDLSESEKLSYAVGLVICDEAGTFSLTDFRAAMEDPFVVGTAQRWVREAVA